MHLSIAAVGSRGDIQPYLALGDGLQKAGHQVQVCADHLFEKLVISSGLTYTPVTAAPVDMMQQNLSRFRGPVRLVSWLKQQFKPLARQFFADLDQATRCTDAILFSTLAFAGYHVAEKHGIPALGVYNIPISPTHAFQNPSAPAAPGWLPRSLKRSYNWWSFRLANQALITMIKPIVNECREDVLGIPPLPAGFYRRLDVTRMPVIYGFSPTLLPRPDDWGEWLKVSGQWFWDGAGDWRPPVELVRFLESGEPPIYVGFGSMVDEHIRRATPIVLDALRNTGQRGILLGGWGGLGKGQLPGSVYCVDAVPHSWLFPRVKAVVHHGGAGTTATGLRYGKPTLAVPFFADQPFWGERVFKLGAGPKPIPFARLSAESLAQAIDRLVTDQKLHQKAQEISTKMESENGVGTAVHLITSYLENPGEQVLIGH